MPPYLKDCRPVCQAPGCVKWAVVEVFNSKNAALGRYCKQDGHRVLIKALKRESEDPREHH